MLIRNKVTHELDTSARLGAQVVVDALVDNGVSVFFANPGTSEIHLVAAIDANPIARAVLCLFEGVATGAADGYARACGKPAAVLLHLGPGLANGLANLHNASKARTPMVVIVGEHTAAHLRYDTPLRSDLDALAGYAAKQVFHMAPGDDLRATINAAVQATCTEPAGPVIAVANADVMWSPVREMRAPNRAVRTTAPSAAEEPNCATVEQVAQALRDGRSTALVLGGQALTPEGTALADQIAQATGCKLFCETFNAVQTRGAGIPPLERIPYFREAALDKLSPFSTFVMVGSRPPVAFFASPDQPSELTGAGAHMLQIAAHLRPVEFLSALAQRVVAAQKPRPAERVRAEAPCGPLNPRSIWAVVNRLLPAGALVSDEAGVTSVGSDDAMRGAEPHVWMNLTGGSIGQGLPVATGAAIAQPDRRVIALHGDGGAMYTVQALWTQVREQAKVINLIFRNDRYAILDYEVKRHGLGPLGPKGAGMFDLSRPSIEWVPLASGLGMSACSVETAEALSEAFERCLAQDGPSLIEIRLAVAGPQKPK